MKIAPINERVIGVKLFYETDCVTLPVDRLVEGWKQAPNNGLQVVAIYDNNSHAQWFASHDYYALTDNSIIETNLPSDLPEGALVKQGSLMPKTEFLSRYNAVIKEQF